MRASVIEGDIAEVRTRAVARTMTVVQAWVGTDVDPPAPVLSRVGALLSQLAAEPALFPDAHFPAPVEAAGETLYLLAESADRAHALYLWRPAPGFRTVPHDHSTWAVVAGIEGEEPNVLWRRTDGGEGPGRATLERTGAKRIGPGAHIAFGPHDIHSVAIEGERAIKHLHLYGRSLTNLPERLDFDTASGRCVTQPAQPQVLRPVVDQAADAFA